MNKARRAEIWQVDFGLAAKVRPALLLTDESDADNELDVVTVLLHTTSLRGNRWEIQVPKVYLNEGAFHCQQVQTVSATKLLRRLGSLTDAEFAKIAAVLRERLGLEF